MQILVPTDFSENAGLSYGLARAMARQHAGRILLVHVIEPAYYPVTPLTWDVAGPGLTAHVEEQLQRAQESFAGFEVEVMQRHGTPFVELVDAAEERNVDLIVMSTHGRSGLEHLLIGSTAEKVVRRAPCPVLTVRPGNRTFGIAES